MQTKQNQLFILFPDLKEENVTKVIDRINKSFDSDPELKNINLLYTYEMLYPEKDDEKAEARKREQK